jgi:hypothetical protein
MDELEHYDRIKKMMDRMLNDLRKSREMHDNLKNKIDMARTDAADELIREVEEYLGQHGDRR